jgi:hypothetical protein
MVLLAWQVSVQPHATVTQDSDTDSGAHKMVLTLMRNSQRVVCFYSTVCKTPQL